MKKRLFLFSFMFIIYNAIGQSTFEKLYSAGVKTYGYSVLETSDGGYAVLGGTASNIFLFRTDALGDTLWARLYQGNATSVGDHAILQDNDGGFICCGALRDSAYILKVNGNGDSLWGKTLIPGGLSAIEHTVDGGFIACGLSAGWGILLVKLDHDGNIQWNKVLDDPNPFILYLVYSVKQIADSGFVVGGYKENSYTGQNTALLYRIKQNGDSLWLKKYENMGGSEGLSVNLAGNNGYYLCGVRSIPGFSALAMRLNSAGDTIWTRSVNGWGEQTYYSGETLPDGGLIACGVTADPDNISRILLVRYSCSGDSLWARKFNLLNKSWGFSIRTTTDAGYIITGISDEASFGKGSAYLIKTDSIGLITSIATPGLHSGITVFPNPASEKVTLGLNGLSGAVSVEVLDQFGQQVLKKTVPFAGSNMELDIRTLPAGIFFLRVRKKDRVIGIEKLVVTR